MKTIKLFKTFFLCIAMILVSCSGEDGTDGDPGESITGDPGADGISCWDLNGNGLGDGKEDVNEDGNYDALDCQGDTGTSGQDGNANVQKFDTLLDGFSGSELRLTMPIPLEEQDNYAFFFYIKYIDFDTQTQLWYTVPGHLRGNEIYARVYYFANKADFDFDYDIEVNFYNTEDDSEHIVQDGEYSLFRIVAIEYSGLGAKANKTSLESTLKAAGVDTNDYNAVANYFGL
ncbi:hypothetical protein HME9304_01689 [Flagellimonas maritima]|uniref:Collagen-like protein n=1 Tax=Flagellimonas maritima TaxID=1383885 RepID=A0A2Z4LS77_9FLAO|nr:hypothetical protein [Allomuricauda aurantiaca]AWX44686.1 hypothetical protein HME9304_01689 [Allomuricauda aurantiaca]